MSARLSTCYRGHKSSCDKPTLFAAAQFALPCFLRVSGQGSPVEERRMTGFDKVVAAPSGRFDGIERPYDVAEVLRLRGSFPVEHTLGRRGSLKLWELLHREEPVRALGAV